MDVFSMIFKFSSKWESAFRLRRRERIEVQATTFLALCPHFWSSFFTLCFGGFLDPLGGQKPRKNDAKKGEKDGGTEPENQGPEPQSARAGAVETHFRIFWINSKNHRKCIHFNSLCPFFFGPFSRLFWESRKRGPGSGPRAIKIRQNGPQGRQNGAQESTIYAPRSHQVQTPAAWCSPKAA